MAVLGAGSGTGFPGAIDTAQTYANISTPDPDDNTRVDAAFANDIMAALLAIEAGCARLATTPTFSNATYSALFTGGNVGIGTTTPGAKLDISANAGGQQAARITNTDSGISAAAAFVVSNGTKETRLLQAGGSYNPYGSFAANNGALYSSDGIVIMADDATNGVIKFATGGSSEKMRITTGGNVGIGTTAPANTFQVSKSLADTTTSIVNIQNSNSAVYPASLKFTSYSGSIQANTGRIIGVFDADAWASARLTFQTPTAADTWTDVMTLKNGNVGIGTTVFGTSAARALGLGNGTAPTTSPADMIQLWAEDISASSELRVRDEAGNVTTLSPHPADFLNTLSLDSPLPWAYRSHNDYVGQEVTVDMAGLVVEVERLSGKKFATYRAIPKRDWQADQDAQVVVRDMEIVTATKSRDALMAEGELEEDATKRSDKRRRADEVKIPTPYTAKRPPVWMQRRGVENRVVGRVDRHSQPDWRGRVDGPINDARPPHDYR